MLVCDTRNRRPSRRLLRRQIVGEKRPLPCRCFLFEILAVISTSPVPVRTLPAHAHQKDEALLLSFIEAPVERLSCIGKLLERTTALGHRISTTAQPLDQVGPRRSIVTAT